MSLVGQQIGRYRILEQLGSGGMSVVYKGLDTALDREVAVKVLHPHLAGKEESRRRLAIEAKAVAKLHHPNILEVFDFSSPDSGDAYIVTEYIRGQTLRQLIPERGFDPPEIGTMLIHELAAALAHAHEAGVIHRDLKPENVMMRDDGLLKLMDFGIAKMIDRDERMTITGALVGSPAHMAPEIIEGVEAGAEADIFSLGTILYLLTTGQLPFVASNTTATLKRILDGQFIDPRQVNAKVSDELAEITARCLARNPADRYVNAGQLRDALEASLRGLGIKRVGEELAAFHANPGGQAATLTGRIVKALIERGEIFWKDERPARALAALNQALSLDPTNERARKLLDTMNVARKRQRAWAAARKTAGALGVAAVTTWLLMLGWREWRTRPIPTPVAVGAERPPVPELPLLAHVTPPSPTVATPIEAPHERPVAATEHKMISRVPPRPQTIPVLVQVKPFGFLSVDGAPASTEELSQHALALTPGKHRLVVSCHFCDPRHVTISVDGTHQEFHEEAALRPAYLGFVYEPPTAVVRIGDEQRSVKDSQARPFEIHTAQGARPGRHHVEFEISAPGFQTVRDTTDLEPDQRLTLRGKLAAK